MSTTLTKKTPCMDCGAKCFTAYCDGCAPSKIHYGIVRLDIDLPSVIDLGGPRMNGVSMRLNQVFHNEYAND